MSALVDGFRPGQLPAGARALRDAVRDFLADNLPAPAPEVRARSWMGFDASFSRRLARRGWVGLTLPAQYGGAGLDAFARFVLVEELLAAGAPVAAHWVADRQSGPLILRYGSEVQKQAYLPAICAGEAFFCIGMSEPQAGSDLAGVRTRAQRRAGGWRLDGRKIWTTNAHRCHYMIALARTSGSPDDRHQGLSQFVIDLRTPGITIGPIEDLAGDSHFNEVLFDAVQLPDDALIGAEGAGWEQVNSELAFERSGPERVYSSLVLLDLWIDSLRAREPSAIEAAAVGRFAVHLHALRAMSISVTSRLACGESPLLEAALIKDLGTSFEQSVPAVIEGLMGADPDEALIRTVGYLSQISPTFSLRGGTREILRSLIARGLGLR